MCRVWPDHESSENLLESTWGQFVHAAEGGHVHWWRHPSGTPWSKLEYLHRYGQSPLLTPLAIQMVCSDNAMRSGRKTPLWWHQWACDSVAQGRKLFWGAQMSLRMALRCRWTMYWMHQWWMGNPWRRAPYPFVLVLWQGHNPSKRGLSARNDHQGSHRGWDDAFPHRSSA